MEKRDLYDINRNLTGETIFKGEPIPNNRYILVVLSFIQNSKGEFLIQKRSVEKKGKFGSTGGHAKSGENSIQAIQTEIKEEIGLDINEKDLNLVFCGRDDKKHVFYDIYYIKKDLSIKDLVLQKEEVDFCEWDSIDEIRRLMQKDLFLESHAEELFKMLDILNKNKRNINNKHNNRDDELEL